MLRCNSCWCDLDGKAVATACQHLFCLKCAQQAVETCSGCAVCDAVITKSTVKVIHSLQDASAFKMLLCGQVPETAFASALTSVQFYLAQQQLQAELREAQMNKKMSKLQEGCRKKLEEVHKGYTQAKRKFEESMASNQQLQQDVQELQAKYAQKAMQARKLQEMLKKLQQENELLRQQAKGSAVGGSFGGRSLSPLAPGDMVTTVQRTTAQLFQELPLSPPNVGTFGTSLQQAHLPSTGRVQGITGGYRTHQGGQNAGGGGRDGGFLGGSLGENSPVLPPASQALGRSNSGVSFGIRNGSGAAAAVGQDPNNNALRKMLGMPPAQTGGLVRNVPTTREDRFSL